MGFFFLRELIFADRGQSAKNPQKLEPAKFSCYTVERKAMELKLTGNALNRSKNHIGERTTDKGVQVGFFFFFIENSWAF